MSTGHFGITTVHSHSASSVIDRLIMLIKRDNLLHQHNEEFIAKMLAESIDYIIYMEDYKVKEVLEVNYDKSVQKIKYLDKYRHDEHIVKC